MKVFVIFLIIFNRNPSIKFFLINPFFSIKITPDLNIKQNLNLKCFKQSA